MSFPFPPPPPPRFRPDWSSWAVVAAILFVLVLVALVWVLYAG